MSTRAATAEERRLRDALVRAADLLATTTTARLALQGVASVLAPEAVPDRLRDLVVARLEKGGAPEPLQWRDVERRLKSAWGRPVATVLDELDRDPVAVTPGAQVHRGVLDGGEVAVKVRRPGVAEAVRTDLALLDAVAPLFAAVLSAADIGALAREVRTRVLDELDLEHEATVQRGFHRALRRHEALVVPAPHTDLAREDVLVSDWVEGTALREWAQAGATAQSRRAAAELAVRFFFGAVRHGTVHADPHPDDVLVLDGGRLAVLDFGATAPVARGRADLAADALDALAAADPEALAAALEALGWLPAADGAAALALAREVAGDLLGPSALLDAAALRGAADRSLLRLRDGLALAARSTAPASDAWPLRGAGGLALLLARLDVEADWVGLARDALREGF